MKIFTTISIVFISILGTAQSDSVFVGKNFKFNDGVYVHFESFKNNQPDFTWEEVRANLYNNPQTYLAQVASIEILEGENKMLNVDSVWGICLAGMPYIRLPKEDIQKPNTNFAAIRLRGKICYFAFDDYETKSVTMKAYNPLNGQPFREGEVVTRQKVKQERMLRFEDGEIEKLTHENVLKWIAEDKELVKSVERLKEEEALGKLFKVLLIYDDRNPVYIKSKGEEKK